METAFGILLFVLVYGAVAYVIYDELTGKRSGLRRWGVTFLSHQAEKQPAVRSELPARGGAARHTAARSRRRAPAQP